MKTIIKIMIPLAGLVLLTISGLGIMLGLSSRSADRYEGHWDGQFVIKETDSDTDNRYDGLINRPLGVAVDIDEASTGKGHIRLRIHEGIPFGDLIIPCTFTGGQFIAKTETVTLSGERSTEHGSPWINALFTLRENGSPDSPSLTGEITCQKTAAQPELFK